uniref:Uncharacterized protein n=1 Tax=Octopus bimaculoides TaxID=37653 RepID=A0A0L8ICL6_OCTBM
MVRTQSTKMSRRLVLCVATLLSLALWQMQIFHAEAAYTPVYDQQAPLKFGRRGLNPNVNSLFFGKRGAMADELSHIDLGRRCMAAMSVCNIFFESKSENKR